MTIPVEQLQNLNGYTLIELFELHLVPQIHYNAGSTATTLYRFHNGTNEINTSIIWAGEIYRPVACEAQGFESGDNTTMARPTLTFANVVGTFSTILEIVNQVTVFNDLQTATVKRRRTLAQFLDDVNFTGNINPYGTDDSLKGVMELEEQEFIINKKVVENKNICSFELVNRIDFEELQIPKLQITKDRFPTVGSFVFQ